MNLERTCAWLAFVAIVLGAFAGNTRRLHKRALPYDLNSPILAMELLKTCDDLPLVVGSARRFSDDRAELRRLTHFDYGFIASYFALFLAVGFLLRRQNHPRGGAVVMLFSTLAAAFDLLENHAILAALTSCAKTPRIWSLTKWSFLFLALVFVARVFLNRLAPAIRRVIGWLSAALCFLAAAFGLAGVLLCAPPFVETGATIMAPALLLGWLYFATTRIVRTSLLDFLNRLAASRLLGWLTTWPSDES